MTDPESVVEPNETPDDVATLYSWANLHGAKYRDFTASRAQARDEARRRVEDALAAEENRRKEEADRKAQEEAQIAARLAAEAAEATRQAEAERLAEIAKQAEAERQAVLVAQEAQRQAAQQRSWQPPTPESFQPGYVSPYPVQNQPAPPTPAQSTGQGLHQATQRPFAIPAQANPPAILTNPYLNQAPPPISNPFPEYLSSPYPGGGFPISGPDQISAPAPYANPIQYPQPDQYSQADQFSRPDPYTRPEHHARRDPHSGPVPYAAQNQHSSKEQFSTPSWQHSEQREAPSRPAWLSSEPAPPPPPQAAPKQPVQQVYAQIPAQSFPQIQSQAPAQMPSQMPGYFPPQVDDTLQGSRDRIANRWFALKTIFDPNAVAAEQVPQQSAAHVPVLAIFSLAGGVGKTSLVASLGRALSSRGERILLVDTASFGLLPFFFGARDQRPGLLRTFTAPGVSADAPIQLVTLDPDGQSSDPGSPERNPDWLTQEVGRYSRGASRILVDMPTAAGSIARKVLKFSPVVLVPVVPDMNSVVSVGAIEAFFRHNTGASGKQILPYYVLNQFDYSLPLHLDVREILREQIGDRLLPFALRRSAAVSEALAEGMTVMDYAPNAMVAEDYASLAGWVRSLSAPATVGYLGVRWSER